jgi:hypothetical protein
MKLRNKKTGEIENVYLVMDKNKIAVVVADMPLCGNSVLGEYNTLAELNEEWEDYKPAEPFIKDEKIRKAVRAWADANSLKWAAYSADGKFYDKTIDCEIVFNTYTNRTDIPECKLLPIAELCGEEE